MDKHSIDPLAEIQLCCGTLCNPRHIEEHIRHLQKTVAELRTELVKVTEEKNKLLKKLSMVPYIPPYHRPPNKFVKYEEIDRGSYIERIAHYLNKNNESCQMTAQILWK